VPLLLATVTQQLGQAVVEEYLNAYGSLVHAWDMHMHCTSSTTSTALRQSQLLQ